MRARCAFNLLAEIDLNEASQRRPKRMVAAALAALAALGANGEIKANKLIRARIRIARPRDGPARGSWRKITRQRAQAGKRESWQTGDASERAPCYATFRFIGARSSGRSASVGQPAS